MKRQALPHGLAVIGCVLVLASCGDDGLAAASCPTAFDGAAWRAAESRSEARRDLARQAGDCDLLVRLERDEIEHLLGGPAAGEEAKYWSYPLGLNGLDPPDEMFMEIVFDGDEVREVNLSPGV